ncbi:cytochrome P450 [Nocardia sp. NBC_00511]|uniref:cytochrome P450 n=1 Tax=Nocardia sp. NBC_00511 TaxID=2903591 RepID=UPI0030E31F00
MSHAPASLHHLPRLRTRDLAQLGGLIRPGTHDSPLMALGKRFTVAPPGFPTMLITHDMDDVREVFTNHEDFSVGQLLKRVSNHDRLFGRETLVFLEGEAHRRERRLYSPPFQHKAVRSYQDVMVAAVQRELPGWPVGEPIEFVRVGYDLALGVLLEVVFGDVPVARRDRLRQAVIHWFEAIESRGFLVATMLTPLLGGYTPPYPPLRRGQALVDRLLVEEIAARRAALGDGVDRQDMLSRYVGTELDPHDDVALARNLRGILLGAYETTAITVGWIATMLAGHPKVLAELDSLAEDDARFDAYLDAVVAETMRVRPVSPFTGRRAARDTEINGLRIPKGTIVVLPILLIHESPEHYPDPMSFRPERFLDERPNGHTWLPFGGGSHRCLGAPFALLEARILFRAILEQRRIQPTTGELEPPRRLHTGLSPARNALVTLLPR